MYVSRTVKRKRKVCTIKLSILTAEFSAIPYSRGAKVLHGCLLLPVYTITRAHFSVCLIAKGRLWIC